MASSEADTSELLGKAAKVVDNTVQISDDIKGITKSVKADGAEDINKSIHEFRELVSNLAAISKEIRTGDGLLHALTYDKHGGDIVRSLAELSTNLKKASTDVSQAAANIKETTETLKSGNGTVGALLVDSKLYDNLVDVTDGAKRSFILKQAIRSSLNK
jgi:ABC-type transporter Mla subunit MlaD